MNCFEDLLKKWCDRLVSLQIKGYGSPHDGGFLCEACTVLHGRADNAVFPMLYMYSKTTDIKYLDCARLLTDFQDRLRIPDGSLYNDGHNYWKATTVFSAIGFVKALNHFSAYIPFDLKELMEQRLREMAEWVYKNLTVGFHSNINYYAAAAAANALCGQYFGRKDYLEQADVMLSYCMKHFTENGILIGEGQPHGKQTEKGCFPVDIGYNMEESVPCLVDAAYSLRDKKTLSLLADYAEKALGFLLPDGGWDNSFGSRNNKWTYYGSRTSDGCIAAFMILGQENPVFYEAASRCGRLLQECSSNGNLYGGKDYERLGQKPCVHHLFCHAAGLADALCNGFCESLPHGILPAESWENGVHFYPEINTYKIKSGKWLATVTGYDYKNATYTLGAAHSSGGTLSLLYHSDYGAVIAGSTLRYDLTEPLNMQQPSGERRHESLIPRLEYLSNGTVYTTCIDPKAEIKVTNMTDRIIVDVTAHFVRIDDWKPEENIGAACIQYSITAEQIEISVLRMNAKNVTLILPVIENTVAVLSDNPYVHEKIFYLSGGFGADEYRFDVSDDIVIFLK